MRALLILWLCGFAACVAQLRGSEHASGEQLTRRAAFDLGCTERELSYRMIDGKTEGVSGCGKHAVYVEACSKDDEQEWQCTWLLNGAIESNAAPAAASAAPG